MVSQRRSGGARLAPGRLEEVFMRNHTLRVGLVGLVVVAAAAGPAPGKAPAESPEKRKELAHRTTEYTGSFAKGVVVDKLLRVSLEPACWGKVLDGSTTAEHKMSFVTRDLFTFFKRLGWGDLEAAEGEGGPDERRARLPELEKVAEEIRRSFGLHVVGDGLKCDELGMRLLYGYWATIGEHLAQEAWRPRGGKAFITLVLSPKAREISVKVAKDGTQFTITGPSAVEVPGWDTKIRSGLRRR
jgi:hypothetical protein